MVCRLIQDQEIGIGEHQFGKGYPAPFSAAQISDPFKNIVPCKQKAANTFLIRVLSRVG